tara:strand:+ start:672 stop:929 length:258 start_codon:yes stop_codon:yes gene_type:complete
MDLKELAERELKSKPRKIKTIWNEEYASDREAMEAMYRQAVKTGASWEAPSDHVEQQLGQFVRQYMQHKYQLTLDSLLKEAQWKL